jgi:hypothetical protein
VPNDSKYLSVSLVWTDYPASPSSTVNLVNDLDLTMYVPDCTFWTGNDYLQLDRIEQSMTEEVYNRVHGRFTDHVNNVERVFEVDPAPGQYAIEVYGYNIPNGPQSYALVINVDDLGDYVKDDVVCPTPQYANSSNEMHDWSVEVRVVGVKSSDITKAYKTEFLDDLAALFQVEKSERLEFTSSKKDGSSNSYVTFSIDDVKGGSDPSDQDQPTSNYLLDLFRVLQNNTDSSLYSESRKQTKKIDPTYITVFAKKAPKKDDGGLSTATIVGIVFAVVAFVGLCAAAIWWKRRKDRALEPLLETQYEGLPSDHN